jgi:hypothetical protein
MSNNSYNSNPTFQLDYLNLSSNRLTTLDVASMEWLNHTTAVTDLTANPWNCDCSVLLEVWRGLKHKLTLQCASPRELKGKSWDVMEVFCSQSPEDMNYKSNTSSEAVSHSTEQKDESEVSAKVGGSSVVTTTLIVIGVLLVCAIGGGIILVIVVKRRRTDRKRPNTAMSTLPGQHKSQFNRTQVWVEGHLTSRFSPKQMSVQTAIMQQDILM